MQIYYQNEKPYLFFWHLFWNLKSVFFFSYDMPIIFSKPSIFIGSWTVYVMCIVTANGIENLISLNCNTHLHLYWTLQTITPHLIAASGVNVLYRHSALSPFKLCSLHATFDISDTTANNIEKFLRYLFQNTDTSQNALWAHFLTSQ